MICLIRGQTEAESSAIPTVGSQPWLYKGLVWNCGALKNTDGSVLALAIRMWFTVWPGFQDSEKLPWWFWYAAKFENPNLALPTKHIPVSSVLILCHIKDVFKCTCMWISSTRALTDLISGWSILACSPPATSHRCQNGRTQLWEPNMVQYPYFIILSYVFFILLLRNVCSLWADCLCLGWVQVSRRQAQSFQLALLAL